MIDTHPDDRDLRLSPVIVRTLMCGAGLNTVTELAAAIKMDKGTLSRALRGRTAPSLHMVRSFRDRFPGLDEGLLVRPVGDVLLTLGSEDVTRAIDAEDVAAE